MAKEPSAAQALYPHLRQGTPEPVQQRKQSLSASMWPSQTPEAKGREADQRLWATILKRQRNDFVRRQREAKGR
jgi:hypothetical protein